MKYRLLGKTGFNISEVSLGTWQLGGKWGEKFNEKTAESILNKAIETGINFIDTADVYNNGHNDLPKYALRWILMDKSVSCVIPGASNVSQVEANSAASDLPDLTRDQMSKVKDIYEKYVMKYVQSQW